MIVMYVGAAIAMFLGYYAFQACSSSSTPSPSSLASAPGVAGRANDAEVSANGRMIIQAIESYRSQTGQLPAVTDVTEGGALADNLPGWPDNPFTNQPMQPGTAPGDYTYAPSPDGATFGFTVVFSSGPLQLQ